MKTIGYLLSGIMLVGALTASAQTTDPDQNPNHAVAAQKYAERSAELTATQSTTVQDTYEAYDWREAKAAAKQLRQDRQFELRKLRYQSRNNRGFYRREYNNNGCYNNPNTFNNGYYNNGYYNNGYYNNQNYNNGYYNNGFFGGSNCGTLLGGAALGLGLYHILN